MSRAIDLLINNNIRPIFNSLGATLQYIDLSLNEFAAGNTINGLISESQELTEQFLLIKQQLKEDEHGSKEESSKVDESQIDQKEDVGRKAGE